MSKIEFRTGTHNPYTLYVVGEPVKDSYGGRTLPGWMCELPDGRREWFVGSLPNEALATMVVEALNAFVCELCPWGCTSCTLNRATCECYEHQADEETEPARTSDVSRAHVELMNDALIESRAQDCPIMARAREMVDYLGRQGWRLIHD